jgi:hypothetical protein
MKKQNVILCILLMSFIILFSSCKKSDVFDIRGAWRIVEYFGGSDINGSMTFSGDLTNGTWNDQNNISGTYNVNGVEVSFYFDTTTDQSGRVQGSFAGTFSDENYMSGTGKYIYYDQNNDEVTCYWICTR